MFKKSKKNTMLKTKYNSVPVVCNNIHISLMMMKVINNNQEILWPICPCLTISKRGVPHCGGEQEQASQQEAKQAKCHHLDFSPKEYCCFHQR